MGAKCSRKSQGSQAVEDVPQENAPDYQRLEEEKQAEEPDEPDSKKEAPKEECKKEIWMTLLDLLYIGALGTNIMSFVVLHVDKNAWSMQFLVIFQASFFGAAFLHWFFVVSSEVGKEDGQAEAYRTTLTTPDTLALGAASFYWMANCFCHLLAKSYMNFIFYSFGFIFSCLPFAFEVSGFRRFDPSKTHTSNERTRYILFAVANLILLIQYSLTIVLDTDIYLAGLNRITNKKSQVTETISFLLQIARPFVSIILYKHVEKIEEIDCQCEVRRDRSDSVVSESLERQISAPNDGHSTRCFSFVLYFSIVCVGAMEYAFVQGLSWHSWWSWAYPIIWMIFDAMVVLWTLSARILKGQTLSWGLQSWMSMVLIMLLCCYTILECVAIHDQKAKSALSMDTKENRLSLQFALTSNMANVSQYILFMFTNVNELKKSMSSPVDSFGLNMCYVWHVTMIVRDFATEIWDGAGLVRGHIEEGVYGKAKIAVFWASFEYHFKMLRTLEGLKIASFGSKKPAKEDHLALPLGSVNDQRPVYTKLST